MLHLENAVERVFEVQQERVRPINLR
jgi:hypothetical protein